MVTQIDYLPLSAVLPFLDRKTLYRFQWGYAGDNFQKECDAIFDRLVSEDRKQHVIRLKALYGYYSCLSEGNEIIVFDPTEEKEICRLRFPRQSTGEKLCVADFVSAREKTCVAFQLVTVGQQASDYARKLYEADQYKEYLYWRGFNAEVAEAAAVFIFDRIQKELKLPQEQGVRFSFGYSSCPNLEEQDKLLALLESEKIGVSANDCHQLIPEESTAAFVIINHQACYFVL